MVVEAVQMYLNLVQVFDAHISKYMIKYNLAAWGMSYSLDRPCSNLIAVSSLSFSIMHKNSVSKSNQCFILAVSQLNL